MNDFYNTYTINVKSGDIAKTLDALKELPLIDVNEKAPVADLETEAIETVQLSFVTRGLQESKTELIDSHLEDAVYSNLSTNEAKCRFLALKNCRLNKGAKFKF